MKGFSISILLFMLGFFGSAHAENVYDMKYQGYLIKAHSDAGIGTDEFLEPIPIANISNESLTFSGDASLIVDNPNNFNPSTCCSLDLGNLGGFKVKFDKPVISAGLDIFPKNYSYADVIDQLGISTVSAVYKNSEGEILGQSSVTADYLYFRQWNNTFRGHESAFGVLDRAGFSEITFSVDGMQAFSMVRASVISRPRLVLAVQNSITAMQIQFPNPRHMPCCFPAWA